MKKTISTILAIVILLSTVVSTTFTSSIGAQSTSDCQCCNECTGDDECECECESCDCCDENEDDSEDEDDDDSEQDDNEKDSKDTKDIQIDEGKDPEEKDTVYSTEEMKTDLSHMNINQYCGDSLLWYVNNNVLVIFGKGNMYDYSRQNPAPWKELNINKVVFRNGIENIGEFAFYDTKIKSVEFASSITEIKDYAFSSCKNLINIQLNKGLESLGSDVFEYCENLVSVTINNTLKKMGKFCFSSCTSLDSIRFPNTLKEIPVGAFSCCSSLKKVTLREGLLTIKESAFFSCINLEDIQFPKTLSVIEGSAFYLCKNLSNIDLSYCVTNIGDSAFALCTALKSLELGRIITIDDYAFYGSGINKLTVPKTLTNIGKNLFKTDCQITVDVKENAKAYKFFKSIKNINVVCRVHCNKSSTTKKATFSKDGKIDGSICEACGYETSIKIIYFIKNVSFTKTSGVYDGKKQIPTIIVKDRMNKKVSDSNYSVEFSKDFKNVGKHTATIKFKNNYSGTKVLSYKILPVKTSFTSIKPKSKGFAVSWKKQSKQTTGYQLQYSKTKGFGTSKTITIKKNSTINKTVSKLSAKKKYYVRVRTYKTSGKEKLYSTWSVTKAVVTK